MIEIEVRGAYPSDLEYLLKTWLRTHFRSSRFAEHIPKEIYYPKHHAMIERILLKSKTSILIAHPQGEPDILLGYLVCENQIDPVVHFIFVKKQFRLLGIAKQMLKKASIDKGYFTHWTKWTDHTWGKHSLTYDPYRI